MGVLHDRMATDLRLRGMSPITQRMYLSACRYLPSAQGDVQGVRGGG